MTGNHSDTTSNLGIGIIWDISVSGHHWIHPLPVNFPYHEQFLTKDSALKTTMNTIKHPDNKYNHGKYTHACLFVSIYMAGVPVNLQLIVAWSRPESQVWVYMCVCACVCVFIPLSPACESSVRASVCVHVPGVCVHAFECVCECVSVFSCVCMCAFMYLSLCLFGCRFAAESNLIPYQESCERASVFLLFYSWLLRDPVQGVLCVCMGVYLCVHVFLLLSVCLLFYSRLLPDHALRLWPQSCVSVCLSGYVFFLMHAYVFVYVTVLSSAFLLFWGRLLPDPTPRATCGFMCLSMSLGACVCVRVCVCVCVCVPVSVFVPLSFYS